MNNVNSFNPITAKIAKKLAAQYAFVQFVTLHTDPIAQALLSYISAGQSTLDSLARELGVTQESVISKLIEIRIAISTNACRDELDNCCDHGGVLDDAVHSITTFGDLAFFLDSIPEVSNVVPEGLWDSELALLNLKTDEDLNEWLPNIIGGTADKRSNRNTKFAGQPAQGGFGLVENLFEAGRRVRDEIWVLVAGLSPATAIPTNTSPHFSLVSGGESARLESEIDLSSHFDEDVLEKALRWARKPYTVKFFWSYVQSERKIQIVAAIPRAKTKGSRQTLRGEIVVRIEVDAKKAGCRLRETQSSMPIVFSDIDPDTEPKIYVKVSN